MLDDFFTRALVAGIGVALVAGPLGCFVIWRRMAYFGDTLSHAALLGVALSLLFEVNTTLAVGGTSIVLAVLLVSLRRSETLSSDALLGLLSHSALALGLVCLAFMTWVRIDLLGLLFGDILAVTRMDIAMIYAGGALVLGVLVMIWRRLFAATVNADLAGGDPATNAAYFEAILAGERGPRRDIVALNAGAGLVVSGVVASSQKNGRAHG